MHCRVVETVRCFYTQSSKGVKSPVIYLIFSGYSLVFIQRARRLLRTILIFSLSYMLQTEKIKLSFYTQLKIYSSFFIG